MDTAVHGSHRSVLGQRGGRVGVLIPEKRFLPPPQLHNPPGGPAWSEYIEVFYNLWRPGNNDSLPVATAMTALMPIAQPLAAVS